MHYGTHVSILNHSCDEAGFVLDEPTIISYKPQILFDTLPTVWQIFNLLVVIQTLSAYYKVYMSQPTHRGAEVLHGLQLQIVLTLHNADQRLLLGLINTLANMWETCLCSASTLDDGRIKLGHGDWCGSHVGSCFKSLLYPDNGLIFSIFVTSKNRLYHWYETNLTEQTHIIVSTAAGSR